MFLSFFSGLFWHIFSHLDSTVLKVSDPDQENFLEVYEFDQKTMWESTIALTYFTFTTLTTVGLGDFHPKSNSERVVCSFMMLFGVITTSLLMTEFSEMIKKLSKFDENYNEQESYNMFMNSLKKFNDGLPLNKGLSETMESYFAYRWMHNRNLAISSQTDEDLLD